MKWYNGTALNFAQQKSTIMNSPLKNAARD